MSEAMLPNHEPVTAEDLFLLCDMFYLPYQHGSRAVQMLLELNWLVNCNVGDERDSEWSNKVRWEMIGR